MYRNIVDFIDKSDDWKQKVREFTWDKDGVPIQLIEEVRPYLYREHPRGEKVSMYGTNLTKIDFKNVIERRRWLNENPTVRVFECNPPQRQYLMDKYEGQQLDPEFAKFALRVHVIDIEVEIGNEFPDAQEAKYPINVMTAYDTISNEYHCFKIIKSGDEGQFPNENKMYEGKIRKVIFHEYKTEQMMLRSYVEWHCENRPDVWTGWNLDGFDTPYIINRMKRKIGSATTDRLSPTNKITPITKHVRNSHMSSETYIIEGLTILDYLVLYRNKYEFKSKQSYKLEDIGMLEVGFGKLSYEGHIRDFMRNEWKSFCWYNIYDVVVLAEVMLKTCYIELSRTICNFGLCEYESIFKSSPYIVGAMTMEGRSNTRLLLSDDRSNKEEIVSGFTGAYVFPPRIGSFLWGVSSIDLNSLYPNIMITNNISPETKIGKIINEFDDGMEIQFIGETTARFITKAQWKKLRPDVIRTSNDVLYCQPTQSRGIFPKFLIKLYDKRVEAKTQMKKNYKMNEEIIDQFEGSTVPTNEQSSIDARDEESAQLDLIQYAYKIFLNSVYGQLGNKYFPLFDLDNAEAVTLSGQHVIKESAKFLRSHYHKHFPSYIEDPIIAGDTDSLYFDTRPFVHAEFGEIPEWSKANVKKITDALDEFVNLVNVNCRKICRNDFNSPEERLEFARETFCSAGAFVAKKRYVLHVVDDEGKYCQKFKYTGLDVVRNQLPNRIKLDLKHIIEKSLLERWDGRRYRYEIEQRWEEFTKIPITELSYIGNYRTPKDSVGFLQMGKGTTIYARSVTYYNHMLNRLDLESEYESIVKGDRYRYVYIKPTNMYEIDVVGYKDTYPSEFGSIFKLDYEKMFKKTVLNPLKHFRAIYNWPHHDPTDGEVINVMDL